MLVKDIKTGAIVVYMGAPVIIQTISVQSPSARGAATLYKYRARNVVTKSKVDITLKGTDTLPEANFERRPVNVMYCDPTTMYLMDQADFQQYEMPLGDVEYERNFITDGLEGICALIYNEACVGISIPNTVELTVTQCDPGVRGNSATSRTKPATLETGFMIHVPEYLKEGERVKVDTRSGEFLSRA